MSSANMVGPNGPRSTPQVVQSLTAPGNSLDEVLPAALLGEVFAYLASPADQAELRGACRHTVAAFADAMRNGVLATEPVCPLGDPVFDNGHLSDGKLYPIPATMATLRKTRLVLLDADPTRCLLQRWIRLLPTSEKVQLPDETIAVGDDFVSCSVSVRAIVVGKNIRSIGHRFAASCRTLVELVISDAVVSIGTRFANDCTALERVTIGRGVTHIPDGFLQRCRSLKFLRVPGTVRRIGFSFALGCTRLETVIIDEGVVAIGGVFLASCDALERVTLPTSLRFLDHTSLFENSTRVRKLTLSAQLREMLMNEVSTWLVPTLAKSVSPGAHGSRAVGGRLCPSRG
jgi:hypothetical protein